MLSSLSLSGAEPNDIKIKYMEQCLYLQLPPAVTDQLPGYPITHLSATVQPEG